jgi:hypothetical protein
MTNEEIRDAEQQISISIDEAMTFIEKKNRLDRLMSNADFKSLILEDYLEKEAVRLVGLLRDHEMKEQGVVEDIYKDLEGISSFKQYLRNIGLLARQMESMIKRSEEELEALREAEGEE